MARDMNLLSLKFWFDPAAPPLTPAMQTLFLVLFAALTVLGVAAYVLRFRPGLEKLTRRALERAGACLLTCGLIGLLLIAMIYERVPYFSMRILFVADLALLAWWVYRLYQYVWVEIPHLKAQHQQQEQYNKWLPKRKKK